MKNSNHDLGQVRERIGAIDKQLIQLFEQRMMLSDMVVQAKMATGGQIYVPEREQQIIDNARAALPEHMGQAAQSWMKTLMRLSRERQYSAMVQHDTSWALGRALQAGLHAQPSAHTIAYQGAPGAYGHQAAQELYPDAAYIPVRTFAGACLQVAQGNVDVAVLPLENSTAGTVDEVYQLLEKHELYIHKAVEIGIRHAVLAIPGTTLGQIKRVVSHPQALSQCSILITGMGWESVEAKNTAFAAQMVAQQRDKTLAALASPDAAANQGLDILLPQASNTHCNQTRFIAVGKTLAICPQADRVSMILRTPNKTGALHQVLAVLADLGLDLAKIQSRPIPKQPWDYSFYVDVIAPPMEDAMLRALYQLEKEAQLRLLGWYPLGQQREGG